MVNYNDRNEKERLQNVVVQLEETLKQLRASLSEATTDHVCMRSAQDQQLIDSQTQEIEKLTRKVGGFEVENVKLYNTMREMSAKVDES